MPTAPVICITTMIGFLYRRIEIDAVIHKTLAVHLSPEGRCQGGVLSRRPRLRSGVERSGRIRPQRTRPKCRSLHYGPS